MTRLSEKNRFLLALGAVLLAGFLGVTSLAYYVSRQSIRANIGEQALPLVAESVYSEIQQDLLRPVFIASMMAHDTFVHDWILGGERDEELILRYLAKIRQEYGVNDASLVSERSRNFYLSQGIVRKMEPTLRNRWYFRVREMEAEHEINVDPDNHRPELFNLYVNYKVLDEGGKFLGVAGVGISLASVVGQIDRYEERFQRRVYFVDRQGRIALSGRSMAEAGRSIRELPGIAAIADRILEGDTTPRRLQYDGEQSPVLVNSRYIPELTSFLVVEQPEETGTRDIGRTYAISLAVSVLVILSAVFLVHLLVKRYRARIESLAQQAMESAAKALALAESQRDFVAMVSHEFGTPLAIIDSSLQGLKRLENQMPPEVASRCHRMARASLRLRELMSNYLTDERLDQADGMMHHEPVDAFRLAARTAGRAEWPGMEVNLPDGPGFVRGDAELLSIVFFNLINNAIKYSPEAGRIAIDGAVDKGVVQIAIRNSGAGINPDDLPRIFEKYYRGAGNTTGGTGLGLYIVKRIVEGHGGSITAESEPGCGACFRVCFPHLNEAA